MRATWRRRRAAWSAALVLGTCALALLVLVRPTSVQAAAITVDSQADTIAVDGACTLREAIQNANNDAATNVDCAAGAGADTITLPAGTYTLSIATTNEDASADGDLDVTSGSTIAIQGAGAGTTTIQACLQDQLGGNCASGGIVDRVLHVLAGGDLTLDGVTVRHGHAVGGSQGVGGGIRNAAGGTLTVTNSTFSGNTADNAGGGILNSGTATVTNSTVSGNSAAFGGGVHNPGTATVTGSTVSGNIAGGSGGGISNSGTMTVTSSTLSGNSAGAPLLGSGGGGIHNTSGGTLSVTSSTLNANSAASQGGGIFNSTVGTTVTLTNSTVSGNSADGDGGGIHNGGSSTVTITNSTVSGNSTDLNGGGVFTAGGPLSAANTIVANNTATGAGPDCSGTLTSVSTNLIEDAAGCTVAGAGTVINADPLLGALADNGGPTLTHALLLGSPALGSGATCAATDQRGITRPGGACDLGAYEMLRLSIADRTQAEGNAGGTTFNFVVTLSSALPAGFLSVTVQFDTADGTATAPGDYTAVVAGTVTFTASGAATQNAAVTVIGDTAPESDETFTVTLSNAVGAIITDTQAAGTITNDDAVPSSLVVDDTGDAADATPGDGTCATAGAVCTLRAAIQEANALAGAQTITFSVSGTITLASALPNITAAGGALTIDGTGQTVVVSGNNAVRPFIVDAGANLALLGLRVSNGSSAGSGGILNNGTLTLTNSTLSNNSTTTTGGGILNNLGGTATLTNSTISGNQATGSGGAISNAGTLTLTNSTLSGNQAGSLGGGILNNNGTLTMTNSTLSNNSAGTFGGGIYNNGGTLTLTNSTLDGNSAGTGGGLRANGATTTITNSILANSPAGGDCDRNGGTFTSGGNNLVETPGNCPFAAAGDLTGVDPVLGALAANGGPTQTHALLAGSPALDAGDNAACAALPGGAFDARGIGRPQGGTCDIGAYEALLVSIADVALAEGNAGGTAFDVTVLLFAGFPAGFPDITLDYSTADGTAAAPGDYTAAGATQVTFAGGTAPARTFTITVAGDTSIEPDETFFVNLSNATGAIVTDAQALITITNDDVAGPPPPTPADDDDDGPAPPPTLSDGGLVLDVDDLDTEVADGDDLDLDSMSSRGTTVEVGVPGDSVPPGTVVRLGTVDDLDDLADDAPPPDGATLLDAFVIEAGDGPLSPPIDLDFTLDPGDTPPGELVLRRWDGDAWVAVPSITTVASDGSVTLEATSDEPGVFGVFVEEDRGTFNKEPQPGVNLLVWNGGSVAQAIAGNRALLATVGGRLVSYIPGAPEFVNRAFLSAFPGGEIPRGTPLIVVR